MINVSAAFVIACLGENVHFPVMGKERCRALAS